jgi:hypothetical protein
MMNGGRTDDTRFFGEAVADQGHSLRPYCEHLPMTKSSANARRQAQERKKKETHSTTFVRASETMCRGLGHASAPHDVQNAIRLFFGMAHGPAMPVGVVQVVQL